MAYCEPLSTHFYDNKVVLDEEIVNKLNSIPFTVKKGIVYQFITDILSMDVTEKDNAAIFFLNTIKNEWRQNSNFDNTNNICAEDVLYICALEWNNIQMLDIDEMTIISTDFSRLFFTQLSDIQSGQCAQGRVIRLWQIAKSYLEFIQI